MSEQTATIASLCVSTLQSLIVFAANFFTIAVFWIHRNKLRRTYLLLINLAVADLLVGFPYMTPYLKALALPSYIRKSKLNVTTYDYLVIQFQVTFLSTSMFFLVLISLERAFALIWPLLHRTTSTKTFIYGVVAAWLAGVSLGSLTWLVSYGIFEISHYTLTFSIVIVLSLATMCTSYLAIRKKLKRSDPTIGTTHQRKMVEQNTRKLSKTLFLMTGASAAFWVPSLVLFSCLNFAPGMFPEFVKYVFTIIHMCNSVANPLIYSLRMPMFRQSIRRFRLAKIRKQRKKYVVN